MGIMMKDRDGFKSTTTLTLPYCSGTTAMASQLSSRGLHEGRCPQASPDDPPPSTADCPSGPPSGASCLPSSASLAPLSGTV